MEINDKEFNKLQKDVHEIKVFLIGDEFHANGIKQRVERLEVKERKRDKRYWVALGVLTALVFLIKWGDEIIRLIT